MSNSYQTADRDFRDEGISLWDLVMAAFWIAAPIAAFASVVNFLASLESLPLLGKTEDGQSLESWVNYIVSIVPEPFGKAFETFGILYDGLNHLTVLIFGAKLSIAGYAASIMVIVFTLIYARIAAVKARRRLEAKLGLNRTPRGLFDKASYWLANNFMLGWRTLYVLAAVVATTLILGTVSGVTVLADRYYFEWQEEKMRADKATAALGVCEKSLTACRASLAAAEEKAKRAQQRFVVTFDRDKTNIDDADEIVLSQAAKTALEQPLNAVVVLVNAGGKGHGHDVAKRRGQAITKTLEAYRLDPQKIVAVAKPRASNVPVEQPTDGEAKIFVLFDAPPPAQP
jgi:outer membrane protein OmpA-like peptidoglycan-associated protein